MSKDTTIGDIEKLTLKLESSFERMVTHYENVTPMKIKKIELLRGEKSEVIVLCYNDYDKDAGTYIKNDKGEIL